MVQPPEKTLIPRNGDVIELTKDDIKIVGKVDAGLIYIDSVGKTSDPIDEPIIRDRQALSEEGVVVIMAIASASRSSR
jgi:ribonuclease J